MKDSYELFLKFIQTNYPNYYIKICSLPTASIKGIINNFYQSGLNMENREDIKTFFDNQPVLSEFTETEFKLKM